MWAVVALLIVRALFGYVQMILVSIRNPDVSGNTWLLFQRMCSWRATDSMFDLIATSVLCAGAFVAGAAGFALLGPRAARRPGAG